MDFPVCPACHQSVLDDDAVDCPFCGSPMKAKPGAKPAAAAAKPATVAAKPAIPKPAAGKPTLPGDDFPFEAELTTGKMAIPAMPNPTKQRSWQVVCPMCDTPGYLPPNAAGKEVRCANAKCHMPVFTAPAPKKAEEPPPPPPPPKPSNMLFYSLTTVVLVSAIGGGLYFVSSMPSGSGATRPKEMSEEDKQAMAEMLGTNKKVVGKKANPKVPVVDDKKMPSEEEKTATVTAVANEDLIKNALKQLKDSCLEKTKQRSKPYCRQLAAEANAVTGNAGAARENLDQLVKIDSGVSYYQIIPLLDLFWAEVASGDKKGAAKTLNSAMSEVPRIPKFGRTRLEIVGRLAVALIASDRSSDASTLLTDFQSADADAQLAARLQIAMDGKVSRLTDSWSVLPWKYPQSVATTASLITRGRSDVAGTWAASQSVDDAKAECLAMWAEDFAQHQAASGAVDAEGRIAAAVKSLPPALAARVWARAGFGRLRAEDPAGVGLAIKLAQEQLAQVSAPVECKMPTIKLTERFTLPASAPLLQAATAAAEIALLQAQLPATKADAESSVDAALAFVDAMAPSHAAAQERHEDAEHRGTAGLRELFKAELKKKKDDEIRTAVNNYKRALSEIVIASQQRFELETRLLSRLLRDGRSLNTKIWTIVNSRTIADDINQRDDFFSTGLAGELRESLKGTDEEKLLLGAWTLRFKEPEPRRPASVEFYQLLKTDVSLAVEFIQQKSESKSNRREELVLEAASLLPTENRLATAFELISKLDDIVVREDGYRLAAALGAQQGQAEAVWNQVALVSHQTEKAELCRGLIAGLSSARK